MNVNLSLNYLILNKKKKRGKLDEGVIAKWHDLDQESFIGLRSGLIQQQKHWRKIGISFALKSYSFPYISKMALAVFSQPAATLSTWSMSSLRTELSPLPSARTYSCRFPTPSQYPASRSLRSGVSTQKALRSFSGLALVDPMFSNFSGELNFPRNYKMFSSVPWISRAVDALELDN